MRGGSRSGRHGARRSSRRSGRLARRGDHRRPSRRRHGRGPHQHGARVPRGTSGDHRGRARREDGAAGPSPSCWICPAPSCVWASCRDTGARRGREASRSVRAGPARHLPRAARPPAARYRVLLDDGAVGADRRRDRHAPAPVPSRSGPQRRDVTSRKGVNLPDSHLPVPALTPRDEELLAFGLDEDVDRVALSFVRTPRTSRCCGDASRRAGATSCSSPSSRSARRSSGWTRSSR